MLVVNRDLHAQGVCLNDLASESAQKLTEYMVARWDRASSDRAAVHPSAPARQFVEAYQVPG
ncbi:hypothetical protein ACSTKU_00205, partial [Vibrio parahaemolyticus]